MQRRRPAPGATRRKTADDHDFLPTGNVFGSPRQLRNAASFCPRCPCSQRSPSISFSFFSLFFHRFSHCDRKEANVRNSHFLGDPGAKTVLGLPSGRFEPTETDADIGSVGTATEVYPEVQLYQFSGRDVIFFSTFKVSGTDI